MLADGSSAVDTHKVVKALRDVGFDDAQAEAVVANAGLALAIVKLV